MHISGIRVLTIALFIWIELAFSQTGPGIGQLTYAQGELFKPVSSITAPTGTSWGNSAVFNGYFFIGIDVGEDSSGLQIWDLSNPRSPQLVHQRYDAMSREIREVQNFSWTTDYGADLAVMPSHEGIVIWDFTDVNDPKKVSGLAIRQGGGTGIYNGIISATWQPPYIYCGGQNNGIFVVDAADPFDLESTKDNMVFLPSSYLNGQHAGPVYAVGNLLLVTSMEGLGKGAYATFDVSQPLDPLLSSLFVTVDQESYTSFFTGGKIYGLGVDGNLLIYALQDDFSIVKEFESTHYYGRGGYAQIQDGYLHAGMSDFYWKIDVMQMPPVNIDSFAFPFDDDWATPMGNLVFVGDDDGPDSEGHFLAHQTGPDVAGPKVNYILPRDSAVQQPLTTKIGISFNDNIDHKSVNLQTIIVRPHGGNGIPGKFGSQNGIVNFTPDDSLVANQTYEVVIPAGGVKDYAGNAIEENFSTIFSTNWFIQSTKQRQAMDEINLKWNDQDRVLQLTSLPKNFKTLSTKISLKKANGQSQNEFKLNWIGDDAVEVHFIKALKPGVHVFVLEKGNQIYHKIFLAGK